MGAQRPRLVATGGASLLGRPRPILVHDHIEDTGRCDEVRNDDDPVSIDNRSREELQIYAEPLTDPAAIDAATSSRSTVLCHRQERCCWRGIERINGTTCRQTAWYFKPFQRTQYLEINNPINTPIVFASMS